MRVALISPEYPPAERMGGIGTNTAAVAPAATGRAKAAVHAALDQLSDAGVLVPLSGGQRNRSWEARGLLDLIADLEAGELRRFGQGRRSDM